MPTERGVSLGIHQRTALRESMSFTLTGGVFLR